MNCEKVTHKKPPWLKKKLPTGPLYEKTRRVIKEHLLHTVCEEARCPNQWECYSQRTATFLIMGPTCTRTCRFCAVNHGHPHPIDLEEPTRVAETIQCMGLDYAVITSVTRDDLSDGGAEFFAQTIQEIRKKTPQVLVEVLIPDFQGDEHALETVLGSHPDVLNHNVETVPRLYPAVRPEAVYRRSLDLLRRVKRFAPTIVTKSGLMLGLGEQSDELEGTFNDLLDAGCRMLTLGQYLQPSKHHIPVHRYLPQEEFDHLKSQALKIGIVEVASGAFVRSSYRAKELFQSVNQ